jgi:hypothetical protein
MMTCREASRLLSEAEDREIPAAERAVEAHVAICKACQRLRLQFSDLRSIMRRYRDDR